MLCAGSPASNIRCKHRYAAKTKPSSKIEGLKMAVNDLCRLCEVNLHIQGTISASKLIFDSRDKQENICCQLSKLGLTVGNAST